VRDEIDSVSGPSRASGLQMFLGRRVRCNKRAVYRASMSGLPRPERPCHPAAVSGTCSRSPWGLAEWIHTYRYISAHTTLAIPDMPHAEILRVPRGAARRPDQAGKQRTREMCSDRVRMRSCACPSPSFFAECFLKPSERGFTAKILPPPRDGERRTFDRRRPHPPPPRDSEIRKPPSPLLHLFSIPPS
jgi:hypothetical protein